MGVAEAVLGRIVEANNDLLRRRADDRAEANPRPTSSLPWAAALEDAAPRIRSEWDRFADAGRTLPRIEDLIDEDQGNEGAWRAGLLVSRGRPVGLADQFPETVAALGRVPGIWSALWSVLEPGTELPEHTGPNAGVLRLHLGIDCPAETGLRVGEQTTPYVDGRTILFDDTAPHAAWNRGDRSRVTLFCEVLRPAGQPVAAANRAVQRLLALDPRYRGAPARARAWDHALNPAPEPTVRGG